MTKPLFAIRDAWPWAALTAVSLLVCVLVVLSSQQEASAYVVASFVPLVMLGIVAVHFWQRWKEVDAWNRAPKLDEQVALLSPCSDAQFKVIYSAPRLVIQKWWRYRNEALGLEKLIDAIQGCDITFLPAPWMVNGVLAGGMMEGEHATVVGPEFAGIECTRALIIHELSHRALNALGIPAGVNGENHHRIFEAEKLGC